MPSLGRLALKRLLQLAFSLTLFVYIIAAVADSIFMHIDRLDIDYAAQQAAASAAASTYPPLTNEQRTQLIDEYKTEAAVRYGFDKPLRVRVQMRVTRLVTQGLGSMSYVREFNVVHRGDGGTRYEESGRVGDILLNALGPTLLLFVGAFLAQVVLAFYLGLWSARRPGSMLDRMTTVAGYVGTAVPPMAAAGTVATLFIYAWRIFPGNIWIFRWPASWSDFGPWLGDFLSYYTLPFLTVVLLGFGSWAIQFRNIVIGISNEDFAEAARARGLSERRVMYGHVARAASPPIVTAMLMGLTSSIFACFFVEPLFHWPGLGSLFWKAVAEPADRAGKIVFGVMLVTGVGFIFASFGLELLYGFLDPRIRSARSAERAG